MGFMSCFLTYFKEDKQTFFVVLVKQVGESHKEMSKLYFTLKIIRNYITLKKIK